MWPLTGLVKKDKSGNVLNAKELHVCKVKQNWDMHRNSLDTEWTEHIKLFQTCNWSKDILRGL